jgi:hypothetical protein
MDKIDILKNIRAARRAHVIWVDRAKALVNGLEITKDQIPLDVTSCDFGKWFYCDGQILLSIFTEEAIKTLENKHKELHDIYMKIFKIYFNTSDFSFWEKLLKKKKRISAGDEHNALAYVRNLEEVSSELISYLNIIEKKINSIDEENIKKYI